MTCGELRLTVQAQQRAFSMALLGLDSTEGAIWTADKSVLHIFHCAVWWLLGTSQGVLNAVQQLPIPTRHCSHLIQPGRQRRAGPSQADPGPACFK